MKLLGRSHIAIILVVIYTLIIMVPLASSVMHSITAAPALTVECSGNCATCGCSAKSMANGTCCCMKKQHQARAHEDDHDSSADCGQKTPDKKQPVIVSCGCRSGNGEHAVLPGSGTTELLPSYFTVQFSIPSSDTRFPLLTRRVVSFQGEPPDPPPKITLIS